MSDSRSVSPRRARPILGNPAYVAPRYHSKLGGRLIFALFVIVLGGGFVVLGGLWWLLHRPQSGSQGPVAVRVRSGTTVNTIADSLQRRGVIDNGLLFKLDARIHSLGGKLKVGDYQLRRNMSIDDMVGALTVYKDRHISATFPEGWRSEQMAQVLKDNGLDWRGFLQAVEHPDPRVFGKYSILRGKPAGASLEGYLFPDTYYVPPDYNGADTAGLMLRELGTKFTPAMRAQAAREGLSVFQVLSLASIVEREARVPDERPIIASVYENRLHVRPPMMLNADPTIQYAVGTPRNWWPQLTLDQLKVNSPYNTYIHYGLPPGPIANPGLASITAVLNPAKTKYFYFVYKGHGRHAFAQTYAEQQANEQKYGH